MKAFTDLEQSKELAKILPITSIDFAWNIFSDGSTRLLRMDDWEVSENAKSNVEIIPCWSLAALLDIIPAGQINKMTNCNKWEALSWKNSNFVPEYHVEGFDTPIDACYELILKLHEHKLI